MKLRVTGYILVIIGFSMAIAHLWPSMYGRYSFMPPLEHKMPEDSGEMVSAHSAFMQRQEAIEVIQDQQALLLYPVVMLLGGAILIDVSWRCRREDRAGSRGKGE